MGWLDLFSSKSSSSSSTSTTQDIKNDTQSSDISGVGAADTILSGKEVIYQNSFDPNVAATVDNAFGLFSNIVDKAFDLNRTAIGTVSETGNRSIEAVAKRFEASENPNLSITRDLVPLLIIATVGSLIFITIRAKR